METLPLRLAPGADLRGALEAALREHGWTAAFVVAGIGSLVDARLRLADETEARRVAGPLELLTLCGTLSADGAHLHASVANARGEVLGGHVAPGCVVRTTAEVLLAPLAAWRFTRRPDAQTGWAELVIEPAPPPR